MLVQLVFIMPKRPRTVRKMGDVAAFQIARQLPYWHLPDFA